MFLYKLIKFNLEREHHRIQKKIQANCYGSAGTKRRTDEKIASNHRMIFEFYGLSFHYCTIKVCTFFRLAVVKSL